MGRKKVFKPTVSLSDWETRREAFYTAMSKTFDDYLKYRRWFGGDYTDVSIEMVDTDGETIEAEVSAVNMLGLVTRSSMAHMFFNAPRVVVKKVPGFEGKKGSSELAGILTSMCNQIIEDTDLLGEGQRAVLDAFIAPYFVIISGYNATFGPDEEKLIKARKKAESENLDFISGASPAVSKSDVHKIHEDLHSKMLEELRSGVYDDMFNGNVPPELLDKLEKHISNHREMSTKYNISTEKLLEERVFGRYVRPNSVFFDLSSPGLNRLRWVGWINKVTREEIESDKRNTITEKSLPKGSSSTTSKSELDDETKNTDIIEVNDEVERYDVIEIFDLLHQERVAYVDGGEEFLRAGRYTEGDVLPNGPFEIGYLVPDPKSIIGVPIPKFMEDQLRDLTLLHTLKLQVAKMSVPGIAFDADRVDPDEAKQMFRPAIGRKIAAKNLGDRSISDVVGDIPMPGVTKEILEAERSSLELIERTSAMGATRLGGGDTARTATASALVDQAISAITQSAAVMLDRFFKRVICRMLKLAKKYYDVSTVEKYVGEKSVDFWPQKFTREQIVDERGVELIIGTMRRQSTDVELKLMGDLLATIIRNPLFAQTPAGMSTMLKLMDYLFRLYGAPIDLKEELKMAALQEQQTQQDQGGKGVPPSGTGDVASQLQGVRNVMGGGDGG